MNWHVLLALRVSPFPPLWASSPNLGGMGLCEPMRGFGESKKIFFVIPGSPQISWYEIYGHDIPS